MGSMAPRVVRIVLLSVIGTVAVFSCTTSAPATAGTELPPEVAAHVNGSTLRVTGISTDGNVLTATFVAAVGTANAQIDAKCSNGQTYTVSTGTNGGGCSTKWVKHGRDSTELDSVDCEDSSGIRSSQDELRPRLHHDFRQRQLLARALTRREDMSDCWPEGSPKSTFQPLAATTKPEVFEAPFVRRGFAAVRSCSRPDGRLRELERVTTEGSNKGRGPSTGTPPSGGESAAHPGSSCRRSILR